MSTPTPTTLAPLAGLVAVVTGASGGIGKATAIKLAEAGAKVALGARRLDALHEVVATIKANGGVAVAVKTDITVRSEMKNLVAQAEKELGPVDILVANAGLWYVSQVKNCQEDLWDKMIDTNVKGLMNGIGAVIESMVKRQSGHIVIISSDSGRKGTPGLAVYSGTKFFVEGMAQAMRHEVIKYNIKITTVQPGDVDTPGVTLGQVGDSEAEGWIDCETFEVLKASEIADGVFYAVTQPKHVAVNEILIQPLGRPL